MDTIAIVLALMGLIFGGVSLGMSDERPTVRKETIQWCIQKPQECKKEFDFYKTQVEVQKFQENTK